MNLPESKEEIAVLLEQQKRLSKATVFDFGFCRVKVYSNKSKKRFFIRISTFIHNNYNRGFPIQFIEQHWRMYFLAKIGKYQISGQSESLRQQEALKILDSMINIYHAEVFK